MPDDFGTQCLDFMLERMLALPEIRQRNELWYQREISFKEFRGKGNVCIKSFFGYGDSQWSKTRRTALKQNWYENLENAIQSNKNTFAVVDMSLFALPSGEFYQWIEANGYELKEPE